MATPPTQKATVLKVVLIGNSGVGKTSLMQQYVNKSFSLHYKTTIGADFLMKDLFVEDRAVLLQIWDTAGQETFRSLGSAFYRGADACMLVFDVTNKYSFDCLGGWLDNFLRTTGKLPQQGAQGRNNTIEEEDEGEPVSLVVVGNKIDLKEGGMDHVCEVTREMAEEWCRKTEKRVGASIYYYETSASAATNVEEAFHALASATLYRYQVRDKSVTQGDGTIELQVDRSDSSSSCDC